MPMLSVCDSRFITVAWYFSGNCQTWQLLIHALLCRLQNGSGSMLWKAEHDWEVPWEQTFKYCIQLDSVHNLVIKHLLHHRCHAGSRCVQSGKTIKDERIWRTTSQDCGTLVLGFHSRIGLRPLYCDRGLVEGTYAPTKICMWEDLPKAEAFVMQQRVVGFPSWISKRIEA